MHCVTRAAQVQKRLLLAFWNHHFRDAYTTPYFLNDPTSHLDRLQCCERNSSKPQCPPSQMGVTTGLFRVLRGAHRDKRGPGLLPSFLSTPPATRGARGLAGRQGCPRGEGDLDSGLLSHPSVQTDSPLGLTPPLRRAVPRPVASIVPRTCTGSAGAEPTPAAAVRGRHSPPLPEVLARHPRRAARTWLRHAARESLLLGPPLSLVAGPQLWAGLKAGLRPPLTRLKGVQSLGLWEGLFLFSSVSSSSIELPPERWTRPSKSKELHRFIKY